MKLRADSSDLMSIKGISKIGVSANNKWRKNKICDSTGERSIHYCVKRMLSLWSYEECMLVGGAGSQDS